MKRVDIMSGLWLLLLLAAVGYIAQVFSARPIITARGVLDATGRAVSKKVYRHIASVSLFADALLLELAEPERILALSQQGKLHDPEPQRYGQRPLLSGPTDLERMLTLGADVLIVNHRAAESELARVRDAGIAVFDLGEMRGLSSLQPAIYALADLLGERARGERLWQRFSRRMRAVADDVPTGSRKHALYVASYAGKLYGGTRGTSYHDVLQAAGVIDVAADAYRDWPAYDPEQLLALDPALIVTNTGMTQQLCGNTWLSRLRACAAPASHVLELAPELIGDPGLRMLDAAERLHELAYAKNPP